jgi:phytoene synthase
LCALFALRRELRESVDEITDPSVAQARLAWWRDEIMRLASGSPSHPVTLALALHGAWREPPRSQILHKLLESAAEDLGQTRYLDFIGLERALDLDYGALFVGCARELGVTDALQLESVSQLGVAYALSEVIQRVGQDARHARIYLPIDELQRFAVPAGEILERRASAGLEPLLKFQHERVLRKVGAAVGALPRGSQRSLRPLLILLTLSLRLLDECAREKFQVLRHRLELTPWRASCLASGVWLGVIGPA